MDLKFVKMQGAGNDFIFCREEDLRRVSPQRGAAADGGLARKLCHRRYGIGADGLVLLGGLSGGAGEDFPAVMEIFNADGSAARICGNAVRCAAVFLREQEGIGAGQVFLNTRDGVKEAVHCGNGLVRVDLGPVRWDPGDLPALLPGPRILDRRLSLGGEEIRVSCLSMGNPHCVLFTEDLSDGFVLRWGPLLEHHAIFPDRCNVEFVRIIDPGTAEVRVWERGCGETLACGTGAAAVCAAAHETGRTERVLSCRMPGGTLTLERTVQDHILKTGPAEKVFEGSWRISRYLPG